MGFLKRLLVRIGASGTWEDWRFRFVNWIFGKSDKLRKS